ncbi:MAG: hypothetical protein K2P78_04595 [Gemmataceae bacterium]|nr:hypothetical protein [Gemmataceae bacterium]
MELEDPTPALEPAALVPAHTLFDPAEQSIATARLYFDRLDPALRDKLVAYLDQAAKFEPMGGVGGLGGIELQVLTKALEQLTKLGKRYVGLSRDAKVATLRVGLDPRAADLTAELTLTPVPGSELAKQIAARKPTTNKFAGLLTPDTAAGFATRLPFFAPELQDATVAVLERVQTAVAQGTTPAEKESLDELFKGLVRTVKTGEFDLAASFRGPDKAGAFTLVGAIAFEDPAALEKAVRKYVDSLPADDKGRKDLKWDVAKAGGVGVHLIDGRTFGGFTPDTKVFGDAPKLAFAFAPHAVLFAVGPDPVPAVAGAVAATPGPAPVLDVVVNPARLGKLAGLTGGLGSQAEIARAFGTDDRRVSIVSLTVEGGAELKVRFALSLKLVPADVYGGPEDPKKK